MKSVQVLRVDPTKQQLLENRINPLSPIVNILNTTSNSSSMNIESKAIFQQSDLGTNQSSSETNDLPAVIVDPNSDHLKMDDNSSSSACFLNNVNNSEINVVTETCSNALPIVSAPLYSTPVNNLSDVHVSQGRHLAGVRRKKKSKLESPHNKKFCSRAEKRIDEIFKSLQTLEPPHFNTNQISYQPPLRVSPHRNSCSDSSADSTHDNHITSSCVTTNNVAEIPIVKECNDTALIRCESQVEHIIEYQKQVSLIDATSFNQPDSMSVLNLRRKIQSLEQEIESLQRERERDLEYRRKSREMNIKTLVQLSELERRATKDRVTQNMLQLGLFKPFRQGAHYEEKWCEGIKYQDLEKRKKMIDKQREENEKNKKIWNKRKPSKQKGSPELEPNEFYSQAEIHDIRKLNINKEEKEIQAENDRLDRERNLHIREIKRLNNEESSRFRDFPILNDRYLILSLLGKGGFSEVHKGFDLEQLCFVACKIHELAPNWPQDKKDSYIKHALREISIHKSLDHNRIVKVHDVFNIDNDAFCTVLEYCEGNDLDFFLKQNKYIPEREAKSIICQLVSALRYLNDRKNPIIHYDLKPGNILLNNSGEIKITDFGLSKIFPDDHHNPDGMELTSQGAGTYWYLPPECFVTENGPPTISSKVDVWSVGVIFFQSLYGRKPFGNNMTQTDILHNNTILQARFISFPSNPKVSDAAKDFIKKCCTYRKEHRPDVFQLCNEDYLKPKAQLKHSVDVPALPGPSALVPSVPPPQSSNPQISQITASSYN